MATKKTGITLAAEGEQQFRSAISNINSEMKLLQQELKKTTVEFGDNGSSIEALTKKGEIYQQQQEAYEKQIATLKSGIEAEVAAEKKQLENIEKLKTQLAAATTTLEKYKSSESASTEEIEKQEKAVSSLQTKLSNASSAYTKAETKTNGWKSTLVQTETNLAKLNNEIEQNKSDLQSASSPASKMAESIDDIGDNSSTASTKVASLGDVIKGTLIGSAITSGIRALASEIKSLVSEGLNFTAEMESYTTSFEVMTGSAEEATAITKELKEVAAATPFELTDLADTTQLLMNYGLTADDAIDSMNMLGDISQGNADKMTSIATAYGQMSSAGKVQLEDVKQMIEAGFNPLQEIVETTGESMSSLYARITAGTLTVDEITASMQRSTAEGGKYYGSMEKQSQTLNGQLSTLQDTISNKLGDAMSSTANKLTSETLPKLISTIENINVDKLANTLGSILSGVTNIATFMINNGPAVISILASIGAGLAIFKITDMAATFMTSSKTIGTALGIVKVQQEGTNAAMAANPIMAIITLIIMLVTYLATLYATNENFRNGVNQVCSEIWSYVSGVVDAIVGFFTVTIPGAIQTVSDGFWGMVDSVGNTIGNVKNTIVNGFSSAIAYITSIPSKAIQWGKDMIDGIVNGIKSAIGSVKNAVSDVASTITSFLHFSVPDEGPLTEYESWMPDFMQGLSEGIESSKYKVSDAVKGVASNIKSSIAVTADVSSVSGSTTSLTDSITSALSGIQLNATVNLGGKTVGNAVTSAVITNITRIQNNKTASKGVSST